MKERKSYRGVLKGVCGVWVDKKPRGLVVEEEVVFYTPDDGKVFKKGDEFFDCVVIANGNKKIEDYDEVEDTRTPYVKPDEKKESEEEPIDEKE